MSAATSLFQRTILLADITVGHGGDQQRLWRAAHGWRTIGAPEHWTLEKVPHVPA
jgi:hypothetical protein